MSKTLLLCDCLGSQVLDANTIAKGSGLTCSRIFTSLCDAQADHAIKAMAAGDVMIACQQQAPQFAEMAAEIDAPLPDFVDIRDRAGWSDAGADSAAKMAALVAEAALPRSLPKTVDVESEGTCLILGAAADAQAAARALADTLAVTVLADSVDDVLQTADFDTVVGRLTGARGTLGNFSVAIDALQQVIPGGRGGPQLTAPQDGATSVCDIIIDLRGAQPLFPAPEKRDGYLRADPKSQPAVAALLMNAVQMIGTFEKPLYLRTEPSLCAHSRAGKTACSRCLNLCPTGAIVPDGDFVTIDPMVCAGCGACAAVCPSGAIAYDAPPTDAVFRRISTLAQTYRKAGGQAPRLLVHDEAHGAEMIRLAARYGRGLPADVIPLAVSALAGFGHAEVLAALAAGFAHVDILLSPTTERDAPVAQAALVDAIAQNRVALHDLSDPDALSDLLYAASAPAPVAAPVLPMGSRRQVTRLAAKALHPQAEVIALPQGAPYGAVLVDTSACTLCLSCVSLCPSGALGDNPDKPQLRFQEDACLQCGLCANICPEKAITLVPQLNLTPAAMTQVIVHEEEPFACIECGGLFGVKSTVEKITEKLAGKHAMFANPAAARMIQMCDTCRINAQYHSQNNPFAGGERPKPRTSDDYLSKRKDH